jgi:indole-3-glycerol phosphate synthase
MTILDDIIEYKRTQELPRQVQAVSPAAMRQRAEGAAKPRDFVAVLQRAPEVAVIAEIKKASPSKGLLRADFEPLTLAQTYVLNGAAAISVLTDERYFQGHLRHLEQVAAYRARSGMDFGLLRKDFIVDAYQVYQARAAGADAVLLIAAVLDDAELGDLLALTHELGMEALLEVHDATELERVLRFEPNLVGVNNRNLHDFSVDIRTCLTLRPYVPLHVCLVAESGIRQRADVETLARAGIDAVLVGESIVAAPDPGAQVRALAGVARRR